MWYFPFACNIQNNPTPILNICGVLLHLNESRLWSKSCRTVYKYLLLILNLQIGFLYHFKTRFKSLLHIVPKSPRAAVLNWGTQKGFDVAVRKGESGWKLMVKSSRDMGRIWDFPWSFARFSTQCALAGDEQRWAWGSTRRQCRKQEETEDNPPYG